MPDSVRPQRLQPTRLPCPWVSLGKNTRVGCHCLFQCMKVKSESEVAQLCPTLSDPMDCSPPGSSAHGVFQARGLESGAIAFSVRGPYLPVSKSRPICSHVFSEDSLALDSLGCILGIVWWRSGKNLWFSLSLRTTVFSRQNVTYSEWGFWFSIILFLAPIIQQYLGGSNTE